MHNGREGTEVIPKVCPMEAQIWVPSVERLFSCQIMDVHYCPTLEVPKGHQETKGSKIQES